MKHYLPFLLLISLLSGCSNWQLDTKEWIPTAPLNRSWDKTLGGSGDDYLYSVIQVNDGGFLLGGFSNSGQSGDKSGASQGGYDYWIVRLNANGQKVWDKSFGGTGDDRLYSLTPATDGGFLLSGYSSSAKSGNKSDSTRGGIDYWIVKIDASGNYLWDKTFGGSGADLLLSSVVSSDGSFLLGGYSDSNQSADKSEPSKGGRDYWVVKIDANGKKLWDKSFGGTGSDFLYAIAKASNGDFVLGGYSDSGISGNKSSPSKGSLDYWAVRMTTTGEKLWDRTFGGSNIETLYAIAPSVSDGGFLLCGSSNSGSGGDKADPLKGGYDSWVVKIDDKGNLVWEKSFGDIGDDVLQAVAPVSDGGFLLGVSRFNYWAFRLDPKGNKLWDKSFGGSGAEYLYSLIETQDGGFLFGGTSSSVPGGDKSEVPRGGNDYWALKIN